MGQRDVLARFKVLKMNEADALGASVTMNLVAAPAVAGLMGLLPEPWRRRMSVAALGVASLVYLGHELGLWEFVFAAVLVVCAVGGRRSYRLIGIGWLVHTLSDVFHHSVGDPMIASMPLSSFGCAIFDPLLAIWYFYDAPSTRNMLAAAGRLACSTVSGLTRSTDSGDILS